MKPKIIAHRGDREHYPENTMASFQSAVDKGADAIELDIHFSKDNKLVVHHDYFFGTTNNGEGLIVEKESAYIKSLDAGSWFSKKYSHEKIPLLEEVFTMFGSKIEYEIELKGYTDKFLQAVLDLAKEHQLVDSIEFTSPHPYALSRLKELEPSVKIGYFIQPYPNWITEKLGQEIMKGNATLGHINVVHCPLSILSNEFTQELQKLGLKVHAYNCDAESDIKKAIALKVEQFSTNKVDLALAVRNSLA